MSRSIAALVLIAVLGTSCATPFDGIDLRAVNTGDIGALGYCQRSGDMLEISVENIGNEISTQGLVTVTFKYGGVVLNEGDDYEQTLYPTRKFQFDPIAPGEVITGSVEVPQPEPAGGFHFEINVFSQEDNFANNVVTGYCLS